MSFLSKLFGGGSGGQDGGGKASASAAAEDEYKGFMIKATPMAVGGEHQLAGTIEKQIRRRSSRRYKFVARRPASTREEAATRALDKGTQLDRRAGRQAVPLSDAPLPAAGLVGLYRAG